MLDHVLAPTSRLRSRPITTVRIATASAVNIAVPGAIARRNIDILLLLLLRVAIRGCSVLLLPLRLEVVIVPRLISNMLGCLASSRFTRLTNCLLLITVAAAV